MYPGLEPFIALRYLRSKRKEVFISIITVISVVGVAVSVMVLNIVLAVMTGFEHELQSKLVDAGAHITLRQRGGDIQGYGELIPLIKAVPDVESVVAFTYNQVLISTNQGARGLLIRGIEDEAENRARLAKVGVGAEVINRLFTPQAVDIERPDGTMDKVTYPALLIGKALRDRLGIFTAEPVSIISPELTNSPQGLVPKLRRFQPVGYYQSGLIEFESALAYASIKDTQKFFNMQGAASGIEVNVRDMFQADKIAKHIIKTLEEKGFKGYEASDWTEPNKPLWEALKLEKQVYFIVLLLLILIASVSIVNTLVMVVMEKSRDIAVLKSLGLSNRSVLKIFLLQGTFIGTTGVLFGTLSGYLGCLGLREYGFPLNPSVFPVDKVPVYLLPENFILVAVSAFIITVLAGVYPAIRAATLRPAEVLRFE